jgi:hypothetical protein
MRGSYLGRDTGCADGGFHDFSQSLQENSEIIPEMIPLPFTSLSVN